MEEKWMPLIGFSMYEISEYGKIRNIKTGQILKQNENHNGYLTVRIRTDNGRTVNRRVHRLVALSFGLYNDDPYLKTDVCHLDDDKKNNHISNLMWGTRRQNCNMGEFRDKIRQRRAEGMIGYSVPVRQYDTEGNLIGTYYSIADGAKAIGASRQYLSACIREGRKCYGYVWKKV